MSHTMICTLVARTNARRYLGFNLQYPEVAAS